MNNLHTRPQLHQLQYELWQSVQGLARWQAQQRAELEKRYEETRRTLQESAEQQRQAAQADHYRALHSAEDWSSFLSGLLKRLARFLLIALPGFGAISSLCVLPLLGAEGAVIDLFCLGSLFAGAGGGLGAFVAAKSLERGEEERRRRLYAELQTRLGQIEDNLKVALEALERDRQEGLRGLEQTAHHEWQRLLNAFSQFTAEVDAVSPPWSSDHWREWRPPQSALPVVRLGTVSAEPHGNGLSLPLLLPVPLRQSVLIKLPSGAPSRPAVELVQSLVLRLFTALPAGQLRCTFIDPVGLGQNVAPFLDLASYEEKLINSRAWSAPEHIRDKLKELKEHLEIVIQKHLRNQYKDIEEYNASAGELAEAYRLLVVHNFPAQFDTESVNLLESIVVNGPRCGVYSVIVLDSDRRLPPDFDLNVLESRSYVLEWNEGRFVWKDPLLSGLWFEPEQLPEAGQFKRLLEALGNEAKPNIEVVVPFSRFAPPPTQWWQASTRDGLEVPLGSAGAGKVQHLTLGVETSQHVLVVGRTGSGKSGLLHNLIIATALRYSPSEIELYLVDFKKGVEFKIYARHKLPHARAIAIESDREFGLSVLQAINTELRRRGDVFRAAHVDNLSDYRKATGEPMPRILVIIDEFQELFAEDDALSSQAALILDRLVRQGRAFGIHVLLGTQTLAGAQIASHLSRSTLDQMSVRIALQCSEADSRLILAEDNPAARYLSRPGEAIYNNANGLVEGNSRFQVAWIGKEEREDYLRQLAARAEAQGIYATLHQFILEGDSPASMTVSRLLRRLIEADRWPAEDERSLVLGAPVTLGEDIAAPLRRERSNNLLVLTPNVEFGLGTITSALISLLAQYPPDQLELHLLDFTDAKSPSAELWRSLASRAPHKVTLMQTRQSLMMDHLLALAEEVQRRSATEVESASPSTLCLVIYGLQRARDLRRSEGVGLGFMSFDSQPERPDPQQQFVRLLRDGPEVGVHTLVWCDTLSNFERSLESRDLREFSLRVVSSLSTEDSIRVLESQFASKLGTNRAVFYHQDENRLEKMRPFVPPPLDWLEDVVGKLQLRGSRGLIHAEHKLDEETER